MRINRNEPIAAQRRIPVYLYDVARQPVTGAVPTGSQVQYSKTGNTWTDFGGTWVEDAGGVYYYEALQAETDTNSFLWIKVDFPGAERVMFVVNIGERLEVNQADPCKRRFPIYLTDITGSPVPGLDLTTGSQVQLTKNGAAFAAFAGAVGEIGQGAYYYEATLAESDTLGYVVIKVFPTGLPDTRYVYAWNVVTPSVGPTPVTGIIIITLITPISTISKTTPIIIDVYSTTVPLRRAWINASYAGFLPDDMVHNSVRFGSAFQGSTNTRTNITNGYRYTLLRDGGWPGTPSIDVHAVDTLGSGDEP